MTEIIWMTAAELSSAYAKGTLSPVEACRAVLARIDAVDPVINAFCHRDDARVLADAAQSEQRWARGEARSALDGVPVSIKELMWFKGWPTRYGSLTTTDEPNPDDDPTVYHMRRAGRVSRARQPRPNSASPASPIPR